MNEEKKLRYELTGEVANYLLTAVNRLQISGVQQAESLLQVVKILQTPLNAEDLDKDQYEQLKSRFEPEQKDAGKPEAKAKTEAK